VNTPLCKEEFRGYSVHVNIEKAGLYSETSKSPAKTAGEIVFALFVTFLALKGYHQFVHIALEHSYDFCHKFHGWYLKRKKPVELVDLDFDSDEETEMLADKKNYQL